MTTIDRRRLLLAAGVAAAAPAIARAATIDASVRTGTLKDVEHVVIFMQENRAFDHYFGAMNGVRGFADRFPIPLPDTADLHRRTVWMQSGRNGAVPPFPLDTKANFPLMRVEGTPHTWADALGAWDGGRMSRWPLSKTDHAMGYYRAQDIPFQYALADAFTLCDAYHCSMQTGTNTNRLFLWTGTNDGEAKGGGPSLGNSHDSLPAQGGSANPYHWTTYVERLQAAGISWAVYQDMADNFSDNPLVGFKAFRDSLAAAPGSNPALAEQGLSTRKLDALKADVLAGRLPQVSYIVAPARDSEHPVPSSPAQGADYTAQVLEALTADPEVFSRTALLLMFDENDGFFDHAPPPAPPSRDPSVPASLLGASTVDTTGEYHLHASPDDRFDERPALIGSPYGLGPRVPMYVISPWSRGGYVNSQVFDHTSVIRFLEARFGVMEPNISPWRRAVCGDLTSAFDFKTPNASAFHKRLPATADMAAKAQALKGRATPATPTQVLAPVQASGVRPSRALPYALEVAAETSPSGIALTFDNLGRAGAVFHLYDRRDLDQPPRRYTVEAGKSLVAVRSGDGPQGDFDLWVLGPNGFHRQFSGCTGEAEPLVSTAYDAKHGRIVLRLLNLGPAPVAISVDSPDYAGALAPWRQVIAAGKEASRTWSLHRTGGWYDFSITSVAAPAFRRRLAGRLETDRPTISDPAMSGSARMSY